MAHRGGGRYTRGGNSYRQHGRPPYWKDRPKHEPRDRGDLREILDRNSGNDIAQQEPITPSRESADNSLVEQSPSAGDNQAEASQRGRDKRPSNKSRLFIANLPKDFTENELRDLFKEYGQVQEVFHHKEKNFGMCRMVNREDAEKAIEGLNNYKIRGRDIKVRFAASNSSVKVEHLHHMVSNELLREAFSQFGEVEEATVVVDGRGRSKGFGIVEFAAKRNATSAISQCSSKPFLITKSPIPVTVSEYVRDNDEDGVPEKNFQKGPGYYSERSLGPRFAVPGDLEFIIASRWMSVFEDEKKQRLELEDRLEKNRANVEEQLKHAREDHETEMMKRELAHHQEQQLRLMQAINQREGVLPPLGGLPPIPPPGMTPLFPPEDSEHSSGGHVSIPGLGLLPNSGGSLFPQPLMGQPGYDSYH